MDRELDRKAYEIKLKRERILRTGGTVLGNDYEALVQRNVFTEITSKRSWLTYGSNVWVTTSYANIV